MPEYEIIHPIRRSADGEREDEGVVSMSAKEAQIFLDRGAIRSVPSKGKRKQSSAEGESEESSEE